SSRSQFSGTPSASYSAAMRSSPPEIARASSPDTIPHAPSMAAWALLAAMSCRHSALSNGIEALISRMIALGPSAKRPPHIWLEPEMPRLSLLSLTCAFALVVAGCDRQSAEPAQQEEIAEPAGDAELTGKLDRSFAGEPMPEGELLDPSGGRLTLAELTGKPTLVNLWATWCAPCVIEMPLLDRLAGELGDSVRVLTISEDMNGAEAVGPFFAERNFAHLPQWMDPQNDLAIAYGGGAALPLTVLYDAEGKEVWRGMGGYHWDSAEARELIAEALPAAT